MRYTPVTGGYRLCTYDDETGKCSNKGKKSVDLPACAAVETTPTPCFFPTTSVGVDFCYQMPEGACDGYVQAYKWMANPTKYKMCGLEGGKCVAVGEKTEAMPVTCAMPSPTPTPSPTRTPCFFPTSSVGADFCYQMAEGACDGYVQAYTFIENVTPTKYKICGVVDGTCKPVTEATEDMPPMCDYCELRGVWA